MPRVRANGCAIVGLGNQLAGAGALAVDVKRLALRYVQALHVQRAAVAQDQVRIVRETNAAVHRNASVQIERTAGHRAVRRHRYRAYVSRLIDNLFAIPTALYIPHTNMAVLCLLATRRRKLEAVSQWRFRNDQVSRCRCLTRRLSERRQGHEPHRENNAHDAREHPCSKRIVLPAHNRPFVTRSHSSS